LIGCIDYIDGGDGDLHNEDVDSDNSEDDDNSDGDDDEGFGRDYFGGTFEVKMFQMFRVVVSLHQSISYICIICIEYQSWQVES